MVATAKEMREQRATLKKESDTFAETILAADRVMTAEERTKSDDFKNRIDLLDERITLRESIEREAPPGTGKRNAPGRSDIDHKPEDDKPEGEQRSLRIEGMYGSGPLAGFPVAVHGSLEKAREAAYRSGMWIRARQFRDRRAMKWIREHGVETREERALNEGVNTAGGALVPTQFDASIIYLRELYGVFRQNMSVFPMSSDTAVIPRTTGFTSATWGTGGSENQTLAESEPTFNNVQLTAKKLGMQVRWSSELGEDSVIALANFLAQDIARGFAKAEDEAAFNGDGTSTYGGIRGIRDILKAGQSLAGAVDAASGNDTFAEYTATDLVSAMAKLPQFALANAKWWGSQVAFALTFSRLAAAAGGNTIQTISGAFSPAYLGFPIQISQVWPVSVSDISDTAVIGYGDINLACTFGERRGLRMFTSEHRYAELDQLAMFCTERVDIVWHDYGDGTTAGPFVTLVAE